MLKWLVNSGWWLGNRHSPLRRGISLVFSLLSLALFLSACTDYVSQIEDRNGEWIVDPDEPDRKGIVTDKRNNKTYKTVTFGSQTWMAQNLNYETKNSYCYKDLAENCTKYGRLYTWTAAKNACPSGWHLPSKDEFETLFSAVGGQSKAGKMLKSVGGWKDRGYGTDVYSFSALPAGIRTNIGSFSYESDYAVFWSSTEYGSSFAYDVFLYSSYDYANLKYDGNDNAFSVRCVKNE